MPQSTSPTAEHIRASIEAYVYSVAAGDAEGIGQLFSANAVVEDPIGNPPLIGRDAIVAFFANSFAALGSFDFTMESAIRVAGNFGAVSLRTHARHFPIPFTVRSADIFAFDGQGLIESLQAYGGRSDISPGLEVLTEERTGFRLEALYEHQATTLDPDRIRAAVRSYAAAVSAGDAASVAAMFAGDAVVEDPVGQPPLVGRGAIRDFFDHAFRTFGAMDIAPEGHVRVAGNCAATALNARFGPPGQRGMIRSFGIVTFSDDGLIANIQAFYGPTDIYTPRPRPHPE